MCVKCTPLTTHCWWIWFISTTRTAKKMQTNCPTPVRKTNANTNTKISAHDGRNATRKGWAFENDKHEREYEFTLTTSCEYSLSQAKSVRPQHPPAICVNRPPRPPHPCHRSSNLAMPHGSVNWHLHCYCKVYCLVLEAYSCMCCSPPGFWKTLICTRRNPPLGVGTGFLGYGCR